LFLNTLGNFGEKFPGKKNQIFQNFKTLSTSRRVLKEREKGMIEEKKLNKSALKLKLKLNIFLKKQVKHSVLLKLNLVFLTILKDICFIYFHDCDDIEYKRL